MSFHLSDIILVFSQLSLSEKEWSDFAVICNQIASCLLLLLAQTACRMAYISISGFSESKLCALFRFAWSTDWASIQWIVCASTDPCFEQRNPWIVHIHGLRIKYTPNSLHHIITASWIIWDWMVKPSINFFQGSDFLEFRQTEWRDSKSSGKQNGKTPQSWCGIKIVVVEERAAWWFNCWEFTTFTIGCISLRNGKEHHQLSQM